MISAEDAALFKNELAQLKNYVTKNLTSPTLLREFNAFSKHLDGIVKEFRSDSKESQPSSSLITGPRPVQGLPLEQSPISGVDSRENSFISQFFSYLYGTNCFPSDAFECIVFLVHYYMITNELACVSEAPNAVPGFAPPLREIPKSMFLPPKWKQQLAQGQKLVLQYKSKPVPTKLYLAEFQGSNEGIVVTLRQKTGSNVQSTAPPYSICLDFDQFIGENGKALLMQQKPEVICQRDNFCSIFVNVQELMEQCDTLLVREAVPLGSRSAGKASWASDPQPVIKPSTTSRPAQSSIFHGDKSSDSHRNARPQSEGDSVSARDARFISGKVGSSAGALAPLPNEHLPDLMAAAQDKYPRMPTEGSSDRKELKIAGFEDRDEKRVFEFASSRSMHGPAHLQPLEPHFHAKSETADLGKSELNSIRSIRDGTNISSLRERGRHFSVGSDDLDPNIHPHPPGLLSPSGGMLVGPDHPMFGQQGGISGGIIDGMGVGGVHEPRFLHIVPPSGEGSFLGADAFGLDENALRGRGRPAKDDGDSDRRRLRTGEPNPDHLKPPGW